MRLGNAQKPGSHAKQRRTVPSGRCVGLYACQHRLPPRGTGLGEAILGRSFSCECSRRRGIPSGQRGGGCNRLSHPVSRRPPSSTRYRFRTNNHRHTHTTRYLSNRSQERPDFGRRHCRCRRSRSGGRNRGANAIQGSSEFGHHKLPTDRDAGCLLRERWSRPLQLHTREHRPVWFRRCGVFPGRFDCGDE